MKFFVLVYKNIKYYISSSKMVFSLFVAGIISCTFLLTYLYGNYSTVKERFHMDKKAYSLVFVAPIELAEWEKYEEGINGVKEHSYYRACFNASFRGEELWNGGVLVGCTIGDVRPNNIIVYSGRTYFTENEISHGEKVAIINERTYVKIERKNVDYNVDTITIDGIDYRIIGTTATGPDVTIPYLAYKDMYADAKSVEIVFETKPSYYDNLEFVKKLNYDFESRIINIKTPYSDYEEVKGDTPIVLAIFGAVFVLISMTFMCLIKYLSDETNHISVIQYVCGASKETVASIKVMTVFLLTVFSGGLGVLLHALTHKPLLSKIDIVEGLFYTFYEYMLILSVVCVSAVIVVIPFIIGFSKNSVITNKNKYK